MNKTLAITTIALVAVVMGFSTVSPIMVNASHSNPNIVIHCPDHTSGSHFFLCGAIESCTNQATGEIDIFYFLDRNNNRIHDSSEPLFCGNPLSRIP